MAKTETSNPYSADIFFLGSEGYGEHIQYNAPDVVSLFEDRAKILETLKAGGAEVRPMDKEKPAYTGPKTFNKPFTPKVADPMAQAAADSGLISGAQVTPVCPNCGGNMRLVKGGISQRTGKKFNSFWVCDADGEKAQA